MKRTRSVFLSLGIIISLFILMVELTPVLEANALTYGVYGSDGRFNTGAKSTTDMNSRYCQIADREFGNNNGTCAAGEFFYAVITMYNIDKVAPFLGVDTTGTSTPNNTKAVWKDPQNVDTYAYFRWFVWRFEYLGSEYNTWYIEPLATHNTDHNPSTISRAASCLHPYGGVAGAEHATDLVTYNTFGSTVSFEILTAYEHDPGNTRPGACYLRLKPYVSDNRTENDNLCIGIDGETYEATLWNHTVGGHKTHWNTTLYIHPLMNHKEFLPSYSTENKTFYSTITSDITGTSLRATGNNQVITKAAQTESDGQMSNDRRWQFTFDNGQLFYAWTISSMAGYGQLYLPQGTTNYDVNNIDVHTTNNATQTSGDNHPRFRRWYICYNVFDCDNTVYFLNMGGYLRALDSNGTKNGNADVWQFSVSKGNDNNDTVFNANQSFYINSATKSITFHHYLKGTTTKLHEDTTLSYIYFNEYVIPSANKKSIDNYTYHSASIENFNRDYELTDAQKTISLYYQSNFGNVNFSITPTSFTYDESEKTVTATITHPNTPCSDAAMSLVSGTDYTLSNLKATNAGTYQATITSTGTGKLASGSKSISWTINKANQTTTVSTVNSVTANAVNCTSVSNQKYIVTTSATAPSTSSGTWASGTGSAISLSGFAPNGTTYYIWTYVPGDSNHNASPLKSTAVSANYVKYYYEYGKTPTSQIYITGSNVSLTPDNSKLVSDWTFNHWCDSASSDTDVGATTMGTDAIDLYAVYKKNVKATFVTNTGSGTIESTKNYVANAGKALPTLVATFPTVSKGEDYDFIGWATLESNAQYSDLINSETISCPEDETYYAYWIRYPKANNNQEISNNGSLFIDTAIVTGTASTDNISYQWYEITESGVEAIANATSATYAPSKKNAAYKCVVTYLGEIEKQSVSALICGDVLVDSDFANENNKPNFGFVSVVGEDTVILANSTSVFDVNSDRVSIVSISNTFAMPYKVYGIKNGDMVLVFDSANNSRRSYFGLNDGVSFEGFKFDSYKVEVTNLSNTSVTLKASDITLINAPRVYELVKKGSFNTSYHTGDGKYSTSAYRTQSGNKIYFYQGDKIKIDIYVIAGDKLTAGSHITVNGEKVFPTQSVSTNGYITFIYTNHYEYIVKRYNDITLTSIGIDETNPKDIEIGAFIDYTSNDNLHNLNFGPLGVKLHSAGKIRFGTVWYFDDKATENSWSRGDGMGTYVIPFKNLLNHNDGKTNDFYEFLMEKYPSNGNSGYVPVDIDASLSYIQIMSTWNGFIDSNGIVSKEGIEFILPYLNEFIADWNSKRQDSNTSGLEDDEKLKKVSKMSFGGAEKDVPAQMYYYRTDESGNRFMEYSVVMGISESFKDRQLIFIPYASYVADWDKGFLAPNNSSYPDNIYLYKAPEKVYTYNEVAQNQPNDGVDGGGAEAEPAK